MKPWQRAFRQGFAPLLSDNEMNALRDGLSSNDHRLLQGMTTVPPVTDEQTPADAEVCGACPIAYAIWMGNPAPWTVDYLELSFLSLCVYADDKLKDLSLGYRAFITWWDATSRREAIPLLLKEVNQVLEARKESSK